MTLAFLHTCDHCGELEERTWNDSWSGKELCNYCLYKVVYHLTNSPASERDNLEQLLENV